MSEKFLFALDPGKLQQIARTLVDSTPDSWSWVDGYLEAPVESIQSGEVVDGTGFVLSRFHSIKPTIRPREDGEVDLAAIIIDRKLPGFVSFDEAAFHTKDIDMQLCKRIINHFIGLGYRGTLYFYSDFRNNRKFDNPEECWLNLNSWTWPTKDFRGTESYPPAVELRWSQDFGGKRENIEPLLEICHRFGLKELLKV